MIVFTGIVEELGTVVAREQRADCAVLRIRAGAVLAGTGVGDSVALNGVCLTVTELDGDGGWGADVMGETLARSTLGALGPGDPVNLERALTLQSRLGGHLVQGHVDGVGTLVARTAGEQWETVRFTLPAALARYVIEKGSIAVDGVSLTVSGLSPATDPEPWFEVGLIPQTRRATTLGGRAPGQRVNLEVDLIAKHVERLIGALR